MNVSHLKASVRWEPGSAVLDLQGEINGTAPALFMPPSFRETSALGNPLRPSPEMLSR